VATPDPTFAQQRIRSLGEESAPGSTGPAKRWRGRLHRVLSALPIFWKVTLANAMLAVVALSVGLFLASVQTGPTTPMGYSAIGLAAGITVLASLLVNAFLVRVALSPLDRLVAVAQEVGRGSVETRVERPLFSDATLAQLIQVFNTMLDTVAENRIRQQELARRVLQSEERERERIAHELYAGTAQTLAGVLVRLRMVERQLANGNTSAMEVIRAEVVNALEEIRGVARRLRPPELDELGVRAALEAHARSVVDGRSLSVRFDGEFPADKLSRESSLALFRIVQEALSNAILHSDGESVHVSFSHDDPDHVHVEIVDDGVGFDLADTLAHTTECLGLFGMHERAGYVQGSLSIESGPGLGTRVYVSVPFEPDHTPPSSFGSDTSEDTVDRLVEGMVHTDTQAKSTPLRSEAVGAS